MKIYNTLSRKIEEFIPINPPNVGLYTCGPTVYGPAHLGHARSYVNFDLLKRVLVYNEHQVKHVLNITDVHDDMIKRADELGITVEQLANRYIPLFKKDMESLNILPANFYPRVSENIPEIIEMIKILINKGFAYQGKDGVYFDVSKFKGYGKLSGIKMEQAKTGTRVETDKYEKEEIADFALWKLPHSNSSEKIALKGNALRSTKNDSKLWDSPWGLGRPGWHIECSVMSKKYLCGSQSRTIDIHAGAMDLKFPHHENEIAQSEAATGIKFVNFWVHPGLLEVEEKKMSKSLKNYIEIREIIEKDFDPLALRYLFLTSHYRDKMNFTWEGLKSAQTALENLRGIVANLRGAEGQETMISEEKLLKLGDLRERFRQAINEDLAIPTALAILWELVKSEVPGKDKLELILEFDKVLGLDLASWTNLPNLEIPKEIQKLISKRKNLRKAGKWQEADKLRKEIEKKGFRIEDTKEGGKVKKY